METGKMKLALSAGALALSMALAGCGGGGSNSQTRAEGPATTAPPAPPVDPPAVNNNVSIHADYSRLNSPVSPVSTTEAIDVAAGVTVNLPGAGGVASDLDVTCDSGAACMVTVSVATDGTVTIRSTGNTARTSLSSGGTSKLSAQNTENSEEADRRAQGVFTALNTQGAFPHTSSISISRKAGAEATIKIRHYGTNEDVTPASIDGWANAAFKRRNSPETGAITDDRVVIYSDIEEPKKVAFKDVYGTNPQHRQKDRTNWFDLSGDEVDGPYVSATRTLTLGTSEITVNTSVIKADNDKHFPPRGRTFTYGNETEHNGPRTIPGTFHGADGEYRCTTGTADADSCTINVDAAGHYTFAGTNGAWVFVHNNGAQAEVSDVDHMHFGYWIQEPLSANSNGSYTYSVDMIYGGNQAFLFADRPMTGPATSATYKGSAAGVYAVRSVAEGQASVASWGEFVAEAQLSATFGDTNSSLQGSIEKFNAADGSNVDMSNWRVDLRARPVTDDSTIAAVTGGTASGLMGTGNPSSTGSWGATFYGAGRNGYTTGATEVQPVAPTGVAGEFAATFANGEIAGAFGASQQP